jgi:hypothetical protein
MPFIVQVNASSNDGEMSAERCANLFNIMAYNNETVVKTTLPEGVAKITRGTNASLLRAGKQASANTIA